MDVARKKNTIKSAPQLMVPTQALQSVWHQVCNADIDSLSTPSPYHALICQTIAMRVISRKNYARSRVEGKSQSAAWNRMMSRSCVNESTAMWVRPPLVLEIFDWNDIDLCLTLRPFSHWQWIKEQLNQYPERNVKFINSPSKCVPIP